MFSINKQTFTLSALKCKKKKEEKSTKKGRIERQKKPKNSETQKHQNTTS